MPVFKAINFFSTIHFCKFRTEEHSIFYYGLAIWLMLMTNQYTEAFRFIS
ncbi:7564_t:CDS:2 [Dentiscutata erythropus]|uniref:7564_t:CDS:1 n=1 Tax=Dentiscutata erythropus TaxID=1348616 RepID=A0A9N9IL06_9GLOM|nr:7564_t:CDS:2 [Dentiscutata erythropus]